MKKLLAILFACTAITCSFVSCGDEEKDSVSDNKSVSEESSEESSEEETSESEEETTEEEEESEEEDDTEEVEKPTHEYLEDGDPTPFLGKWECEKMVIEGEEMTDLMGIPVYAVFQLEIKDDFTATMAESSTALTDAEDAIVYTWGIISETEMELVNNMDESMIFTVDGDYLVGTQEGYDELIYLVSVDEFTPFDFEEFMNGIGMESEESESTDDSTSGEDVLTDESSESEESSEVASTEIAE